MVILYYSRSSKTSRQSIAWFEGLGIKFKGKRIENITKQDLVHILSLSEDGFPDLLKRATGRRLHINEVKNYINSSSFNDAVDYLLENTDVIKVPIIFDEHKLVIGYNTESIRVFVTREHRKGKMILKRI
jgi:regulatory protein spx